MIKIKNVKIFIKLIGVVDLNNNNYCVSTCPNLIILDINNICMLCD